eukprot:980931-Pyramimonas_sp.AAC.1
MQRDCGCTPTRNTQCSQTRRQFALVFDSGGGAVDLLPHVAHLARAVPFAGIAHLSCVCVGSRWLSMAALACSETRMLLWE